MFPNKLTQLWSRSQTSSAEGDLSPNITIQIPVQPVPAICRPDLTPSLHSTSSCLRPLLQQWPVEFRSLAVRKRSSSVSWGLHPTPRWERRHPGGSPRPLGPIASAWFLFSLRAKWRHGAFCPQPPCPKMLQASGSKPAPWGLGSGVPSLVHRRPRTVHFSLKTGPSRALSPFPCPDSAPGGYLLSRTP